MFDATDQQRKQAAVLVLILGVAFLLRFWGIWFGLPFSFRADEYHEVFRALELGTGSFNFERTGKGGYFYVLFVEYGALFVTLKLAGIVESANDFARYFVRDPSAFYLLGRLTTAIVGTINVFLAYRLGLRAYGMAAGLLAAGFLAVDFLNTEHSHFVTVDVPMTCLATASLLFAVRMVTQGRAADYKWAALFAALAATTKLPAVLLLIPLVLAHYYFVRDFDPGRRFFRNGNLWTSAAIFLVVLVATNPGLLVEPPWHMLSHLGGEVMDPELAEEMTEPLAPRPSSLFIYYGVVIADSMGWPLFVLSLAGVAWALWKRTPTDVLLLSFAVPFYVVFASTSSLLYYPRYILPVIVVLCLLGARAAAAVLASPAVAGRGPVMRGATISMIVLFAAWPASQSVANDWLLTRTDTRKLAKEWFDENVPPRSRVMIEGVKITPSRLTVPLRDTVENMREYIDYYKTREPGKSKFLSYAVQVDTGTAFDLELVKRTDLRSVDYYKSRGVEYLVVRPEAFALSRRIGAAGRSFLDELRDDPELEMVRRFEGDPATRPGPDIEIWRVNSNAEAASH